MGDTHSDCRSPDGITVALVDSIITAVRLLRQRDLRPYAVQEALLDMATDDDFRFIYSIGLNAVPNSDCVCTDCRWRGGHSPLCVRVRTVAALLP